MPRCPWWPWPFCVRAGKAGRPAAAGRATGGTSVRLAGIRYDPDDPRRSDLDLWHREITVHGKGRKTRTVKISHDAARALDRYLRVRTRQAQSYRPQLWLGISNRGPMTASGVCQVIARRGRECGIEVFPHRFRHHFSYTSFDRGGAEGDLMELNGWTSRRCSAATAPAPAMHEPAAATTASWTTPRNPSPPGFSRDACPAGIPEEPKYPPDRYAWVRRRPAAYSGSRTRLICAAPRTAGTAGRYPDLLDM